MSSEANAAILEAVRQRYASASGPVNFADMLREVGSLDDMVVAELIEIDARNHFDRGESVDLERYLAAVPNLVQWKDSLDAAIDVSLRSLSRGKRITPEAIEQLKQRYPHLATTIREATVLTESMWSTTGLKQRMSAAVMPPPKLLPCDFGPLLATGPLANKVRRYELQQLLGQGGFGQVYLAHDRQLSEEGHVALVAIKILPHEHRSPMAREKLIEEATKVRRINHANVVMVLDRGVTEQDEDFIVYEYVDGGDLRQLMNDAKRLPVRDAASMMVKIALGVHAAHSAGVIHCDLKPSNIMLTASREPKVADFGISVRLDQANSFADYTAALGIYHASDAERKPIGSIAFVSPEQFRGEDGAVSVPSDVYALGGIFYLLLTGRLPNGESPEEIARNHHPENGRLQPPMVRGVNAEVDRDLEAICQRALMPNASDRYNSAASFAEDLERWLKREPIAWTKPGAMKVMRLWSRRKPALAASVGALIVLTIVGTVIALRLNAVANKNAFDAEVAKLKAQSEENERLRTRAIATQYVTTLRRVKDYRMSTDALLTIWALEYLYGPKVMNLADQTAELWQNRIIHIRHLVKTANEQGRSNELETLLWESALAFWLVSTKDHDEAIPLLNENIAKWQRRLAADDPWLADLDSMLACAEANRLAILAKENSPIDLDRARVIEQQLLAHSQRIPDDRKGTPMHYLILETLADLYGPALLNDVNQQKEIRALRQRYVDRKAGAKT